MTVKALMPVRKMNLVVPLAHKATARRTVVAAVRRLQEIPAADVYTAGNSYLGLLRQASHSHGDQAAVMNVLRKRGHSFKPDLTKIFRKAA